MNRPRLYTEMRKQFNENRDCLEVGPIVIRGATKQLDKRLTRIKRGLSELRCEIN